MMIIGPPQQGHGYLLAGGSAVCSLALPPMALMVSIGIIGGVSSSRARAIFSARLPLASRP